MASVTRWWAGGGTAKSWKSEVMAGVRRPGRVGGQGGDGGINANVVHRWRQLAREDSKGCRQPREFVAVAIAPQVPALGQARRDIEIELRRGAVTMKVIWPVRSAADFAAWTREVLR
ncbi:MAG: IS66 family insertion sequence element accessory protein TnpB [Betaproteobacteria bacterium]|nr:IS66 family insertion sequence element accessory protein TnpB [Betaproteobacteria bacterium]